MEITVNIVDTLFDSIPKGTVVANYVTEVDTVNFKMYSTVYSIDEINKAIVTTKKVDANNLEAIHFDAINWVTTDKATIDNIYPKVVSKYQNKFKKEGVIYKITKDYDLNGCVLTIPDNCTLQFEGGSFSNGTIRGSNTKIIYNNTVFNACTLQGTFNVELITDNIITNTNDIDKLKNISVLGSGTNYKKIVLNNNYVINSFPIDSYALLRLYSNTDLVLNGSISVNNISFPSYNIIFCSNASNINISGGKLVGDIDTHIGKTGEFGYGITLASCENVTITDINISKCWGDGIAILRDNWNSPTDVRPCKNILIDNVICDSNRRQGLSIIALDGAIIRNSKFINTGTIKYTAPGYGIDIEPNNQYESVTNVTIDSCEFINNKDSISNYDKSISLYAPTNKNISNVIIQNCITTGELTVNGANNITVNRCNLYTCSFSNILLEDNIKVSNNYITRAENYTWNNFLKLTNNVWAFSARVDKTFSPNNAKMKLVFPKFSGFIKVTVISNYYNYIKEVWFNINTTGLVGKKNYTKYINTGSVGPVVNNTIISTSTQFSAPIEKENNVEILTNTFEPTVKTTIFLEAYALYTDNAVRIRPSNFNLVEATDAEMLVGDFSELVFNPTNVTATTRPISPQEGYSIYDSTWKQSLVYDGSSWLNMDGSSSTRVRVVKSASQLIYQNVIYKIVADIDFNGANLTIPPNCTLDFQGGSFSNGTLVGNNTKIKAGLNKIFDTNITLNGTWDIDEAYPEWFGEKTSTSIQLCLDYFPVVKLGNSTYTCSTSVVISNSAKVLKGEQNNTVLDFSTCSEEICINVSAFRAVLQNVVIKTDNFVENQIGVSFTYSTENGQIENVIVQGFYNGININKTWYSVLNNIRIRNVSPQGYGMVIGSLAGTSKEEINNISFNNIWIEGGKNSIVFNNIALGAVVFDTCTFESTQETALKTLSQVSGAVSFKNCYFEKNYLSTNRTVESIVLWYKGTNDIQAYFDGGLYRDQSAIKSYIVDNASFISPMYVANAMNFGTDRVIDYTPNGINATKFNKRRYYNESFLQTSFNSLDEQTISLRPIYSSFELSTGEKKKFATIVLSQDVYYSAYIKVDLIVRAKRPNSTIQGMVSYIIYIDKYSSTASDQGMWITQADEFIQKKFSNSNLDLRESILLKGKVLPYNASFDTSPFILYIDAIDGADYIINARIQGYRTDIGTNSNNFIIKEDAILTSDELAATDARVYNKIGITNNRPLGIEKGFEYYDTTLSKYICWNGTTWTNLDGSTLT